MKPNRLEAKKWKIIKLKPHPRQESIFCDVPDEELAALAENIKKHGLRDPVEILPDGTIICGHQRVRAAKLLGWKEVDVIIREDLAAAGPEAVETYFVEDNLLRRQLSPLGRARCLKRLAEIEEGKAAAHFGFMKKEALKAQLAERMQMSPRNIDRYLLILNSPIPVQLAFDRNEISLINTGKVALMSETAQNDIAQRIENGEAAAKVIADYLAAAKSNVNEVERAFDRLYYALKRDMPYLGGRRFQINQRKLTRTLPTLKEAESVLSKIIKQVERKHPDG